MRLFIAEKNSLAKAVVDVLGLVKSYKGYYECKNNCIVTYCAGHLLALCDPEVYLNKKDKLWDLNDLPIIPTVWKKHIIQGKSAQLQLIKSLSLKASEVVNLGDPDREGQYLVDEVIKYCGFKGRTLRLLVNGTDPVSVGRALNHIEDNSKYVNLGYAAEARNHADWLVGMNLTRQVSVLNNTILTIGRVQTPLLQMVQDREDQFNNFKAKPYYNVVASVKTPLNVTFKAKWDVPSELLVDNLLLDMYQANECRDRNLNSQAVVEDYQIESKFEEPLLPYNLSKLQIDCAKLLKFSAKKTLDTLQELYEEHKLATYPRSSCQFLPSSQQADVSTILGNLESTFSSDVKFQEQFKFVDPNRKSKVWNDKKVSEEAHTAIIPTLRAIDPIAFSKLSKDCQNLYKIIAQRYIQVFLPNFSYQSVTIKLKSTCGDTFVSTLKKVINIGFKQFSQEQTTEELTNIPVLNKGSLVSFSHVEVVSNNTKPKPLYTEGSLLDAMEHVANLVTDVEAKKILKEIKGIGTPATQATIVAAIKERGYVDVVKGKYHITQKGRYLLSLVPEKLKSPILTAEFEKLISKINEGQLSIKQFENDFVDYLKNIMDELYKMTEEKAKKCPVCGNRLYHNISQKSDFKYFKCSNKDCGKSFKDENGEVGSELVSANLATCECPKCSKTAYRYESKKKPGSFFWVCKSCNTFFSDNNGQIGAANEASKGSKCPNCSKNTCRRYKNKSNDKYHWFCSACRNSFFDDDNKIGNMIKKLN